VITLVLGALSFSAGRWTPGKRKTKRHSDSRDEPTPPAEVDEPQKALAAVAYQ
jgi:hypothetical protein